MFEYEQETYGSKGRERIRAAAMASGEVEVKW